MESCTQNQLISSKYFTNLFQIAILKYLKMASNWILGEKFDYEYPHHGSMKDLWEKKWGPLVCALRNITLCLSNLQF